MYTIGECSRVTGISIKALRLYHEKGVLVPHTVDSSSGYRYYTQSDIDKARAIKYLRDLDFSLNDIKEIIASERENEDILRILERHYSRLKQKQETYSILCSSLSVLIEKEKESKMGLQHTTFEVIEKRVSDQLVAAIRFKGRYDETGHYLGLLCRKTGWLICGKPFNLYYDSEYKENDADIESCVPIRKEKPIEGVTVKTLPGGRCFSLIHKGPYDQIGRSYEKLIAHIKEQHLETFVPSREIYIKGPGMFFRGNPRNYLTELQMFISDASQ